jgi:mRNA-degrading endonuclease RelE of RelBE toxin-antitoxin system
MKTLSKLFKPYPLIIKNRYFQRAVSIQNKLNSGDDYQHIGGKRLVCAKGLIRFKLGAYRLIFKREQLGYIPELLLHIKNLERFLKRM